MPRCESVRNVAVGPIQCRLEEGHEGMHLQGRWQTYTWTDEEEDAVTNPPDYSDFPE